jgi:hypothetical protein
MGYTKTLKAAMLVPCAYYNLNVNYLSVPDLKARQQLTEMSIDGKFKVHELARWRCNEDY